MEKFDSLICCRHQEVRGKGYLSSPHPAPSMNEWECWWQSSHAHNFRGGSPSPEPLWWALLWCLVKVKGLLPWVLTIALIALTKEKMGIFLLKSQLLILILKLHIIYSINIYISIFIDMYIIDRLKNFNVRKSFKYALEVKAKKSDHYARIYWWDNEPNKGREKASEASILLSECNRVRIKPQKWSEANCYTMFRWKMKSSFIWVNGMTRMSSIDKNWANCFSVSTKLT